MANIRVLSQSLQRKVERELNEVPANIDRDLAELRRLIHQVPHMKARLEDQFLVTFLRGSKYDVEKALRKVEMFYTCRTSLPELMMNRDPLDPQILEIVRMGIGLPLPLTEKPDSPRVILIRPGAYDATRYRMIDIMKVPSRTIRRFHLILISFSFQGRQHDLRHFASRGRQLRHQR